MKLQPRIAVIGSANIDLVTYTDEFPRPGETIFGREFSLRFGGKGANQAVAARLCGAEVAMVARVGDGPTPPPFARRCGRGGERTGRRGLHHLAVGSADGDGVLRAALRARTRDSLDSESGAGAGAGPGAGGACRLRDPQRDGSGSAH